MADQTPRIIAGAVAGTTPAAAWTTTVLVTRRPGSAVGVVAGRAPTGCAVATVTPVSRLHESKIDLCRGPCRHQPSRRRERHGFGRSFGRVRRSRPESRARGLGGGASDRSCREDGFGRPPLAETAINCSPRNEEARSIKAGFCRERRYANLGHLLPSLYRASGETRCVGPPSSLIDQPLLL